MTVRAGGGVVVRSSASGIELLIVHRPHYDDWTFPKGKQDPGETDLETAWREVTEETGFEVRPLRELPSTNYVDGRGRDKLVRYWTMAYLCGEFVANEEVDAVEWLSPADLAPRLTYDRDREMLAQAVDRLDPCLHVLVTNDDGIDAPGLGALAKAFVGPGRSVVVAAPSSEFSGSSASIGLVADDSAIDINRVSLPGLEQIEAIAVDGPPAMIVLLANLGVFGPRPDLVVSGINPGYNTGRSTLHSGTVGAALTAIKNGIAALAVSQGAGPTQHFDDAAQVAFDVAEQLLVGAPTLALNLNMANGPLESLGDIEWAEVAPIGAVHVAITEVGESHIGLTLAATDQEFAANTDTAIVRAGGISLTALVGPVAIAPPAPLPVIRRALAANRS